MKTLEDRWSTSEQRAEVGTGCFYGKWWSCGFRVCGHQPAVCGLSRLLRLYGTTQSSILIQFHQHGSPANNEANKYWC